MQNKGEPNRIHMENGIKLEQYLISIMISVLYQYAEKLKYLNVYSLRQLTTLSFPRNYS